MSDTANSFRYKWETNSKAFFEETLREGSEIQRWILERNGFANCEEFAAYLADKRRILDAGCGNGRVTALLRRLASPLAEIVGIDLVGADIARENFKHVQGVRFETYDILGDLTSLGQFDFIYCQEVLHHTANPLYAFQNLCSLLAPKGEIAIYVYKKKAPVREFVDDYVRHIISSLPHDEAMTQCAQITEFGRSLSEAGVKVKVPSVDILGIEAGEYDIQRLIYIFS